MDQAERWISQSSMSEIGRHEAAVAALPCGIAALNEVVQGVIIHSDWLGAYGVEASQLKNVSRDTLPTADRLDLVLDDGLHLLTDARAPVQRTVGTCRDFALMLCAFLRRQGIPARLRCGFADYWTDGWEDHWVCEYWDRQTQRWHLSDPQIDEVLKARCAIAFDPADMPRDRFMTAGQTWAACRTGRQDALRFGHGNVTGLWFVMVNVVRDHYAINNRETSAWDGWRAASEPQRVVLDRELALMDNLAARPEQSVVEIEPDWLS